MDNEKISVRGPFGRVKSRIKRPTDIRGRGQKYVDRLCDFHVSFTRTTTLANEIYL